MLIVRQNGSKYYNYYLWDNEKYKPYDYEKNGLLNKILSNVIVSTNNSILKNILLYYEKSLILLLKYVDKLKNFKNIHWKNR